MVLPAYGDQALVILTDGLLPLLLPPFGTCFLQDGSQYSFFLGGGGAVQGDLAAGMNSLASLAEM